MKNSLEPYYSKSKVIAIDVWGGFHAEPIANVIFKNRSMFNVAEQTKTAVMEKVTVESDGTVKFGPAVVLLENIIKVKGKHSKCEHNDV